MIIKFQNPEKPPRTHLLHQPRSNPHKARELGRRRARCARCNRPLRTQERGQSEELLVSGPGAARTGSTAGSLRRCDRSIQRGAIGQEQPDGESVEDGTSCEAADMGCQGDRKVAGDERDAGDCREVD